MIEDIKRDAEARMRKSIEALTHELAKVRTGRAHPSLLEHVKVEYYGNEVPLNQVASIAVADARTLTVTPWEKNMVGVVEKAILSSDLGLNPTNLGHMMRVPLPPLTEERRRDLTKVVRSEAEGARVAIRNVRRDAIHQLKDLVKDKAISEDDEHRAEDVMQKLTDKYTAEVDRVLADKEEDLMAL